MKWYKLAFLGWLTLSQQVSAQDFPVCDMGERDEQMKAAEVFPCQLKNDPTLLLNAVVSMMLDNKKGMRLVQSTGHYGLMLPHDFDNDGLDIKIMLLSSENDIRNDLYRSKVKYEIVLSDCEGTDACGDSYLWTVIADREGDGYTYSTKYTNTLKKM